MTMIENKNVVKAHGCIVCARLFNILAVYAPDGGLVDCTVTSSSGRIVPNEQQPMVACETHSAEEVEAAYIRWQARNARELTDEQDNE